MFLTIGLMLLVLWALGAFVLVIASAWIHALLVVALLSIVWHLASGRKTA